MSNPATASLFFLYLLQNSSKAVFLLPVLAICDIKLLLSMFFSAISLALSQRIIDLDFRNAFILSSDTRVDKCIHYIDYQINQGKNDCDENNRSEYLRSILSLDGIDHYRADSRI
ncbi:hypothetical protein TRIP_E160126 [uncultured Spirochaetota bacterium]|uniref:Uncharacterized protein n=1 Tax=uncultured Spirochaetota bacterium TaxID=460511 RepID=A0A652ZT02_9SPIR|nr:hypothetical protein TRIP_E160126 [uncultured Spirochaetota bacterium]